MLVDDADEHGELTGLSRELFDEVYPLDAGCDSCLSPIVKFKSFKLIITKIRITQNFRLPHL